MKICAAVLLVLAVTLAACSAKEDTRSRLFGAKVNAMVKAWQGGANWAPRVKDPKDPVQLQAVASFLQRSQSPLEYDLGSLRADMLISAKRPLPVKLEKRGSEEQVVIKIVGDKIILKAYRLGSWWADETRELSLEAGGI